MASQVVTCWFGRSSLGLALLLAACATEDRSGDDRHGADLGTVDARIDPPAFDLDRSDRSSGDATADVDRDGDVALVDLEHDAGADAAEDRAPDPVLDPDAQPEASVPVVLSGVVTYDDRPFDGNGFTGERVPRPVASAVVELVRDLDETVVASGTTDAGGAYALDAMLVAGLPHHVRVLAVASSGDLRVRVQDRSQPPAIYALASAAFLPENAPEQLDLHGSADAPGGGAFNVLAVTQAAFAFIGPLIDPLNAAVSFRWEPGRAWSCRSCYSDRVIYLGGPLEDPDEYDDDIVLHELGHFFQDLWRADDSPGGSHEGERLDPLLAWGEGSATFMSSWVQADPEYIDLYFDSLRLRDLETAAEDEEFWGTDGGVLSGDVSEYLVAAVLWDAIDGPAEAEPSDGLELADDAMAWLLAEFLGDSDRVDLGVGGIDLADWLNGAACSFPESNPGVLGVVGEREFPWDPETDVACSKGGEPSLALLEARQGALWLVAAGDVSRAGDGELALTLYASQGSSGFAARTVVCDGLPCAVPVELREDLAVVVSGAIAGAPVLASWVGADTLRAWMGEARSGQSPHGPVRELPAGAGYASTRFLPRFLAR